MGKDTEVGQVVVMEIGFPRTQEFSLECRSSESAAWKELAKGTTLGPEKKITFPPVTTRYIRLNIFKANGVPTIEEVRVM
ncbi:MAG: hypothetical protein NTX50_04595 [Candidatus Sumerlaeota bacterium]|nr:hypothetical protein [Candidatus Sumerlaeota bacterium]